MGSIPEHCPSCQSHLVITELSCPVCGTKVNGEYEPNIFSRLSPDDLNFITLFVQAKGNLKDMERSLGISYWTIRRKLDDIVEFLSKPETPVEPRTSRQMSVLDRLKRGEISVQEAAAMLEQIKRGE